MNSVKEDIFGIRFSIFTQGDGLPLGSGPLILRHNIITEVETKTVGAEVNMLVPLNYRLGYHSE